MQLQPDLSAAVQNPLRQFDGFDLVKYWAHQHTEPIVEIVLLDRADRPIKITARGNYKLCLICFFQPIKVGPVIVLTLAAIRAFDVHDDVNAAIHGSHIMCSAGFEQYLPATVQKSPHQWMHFGLQEGLAASDFDERTIDRHRTLEYLINWHLLALLKGVRRVAPAASGIANSQADENARQTGKGGFALQAAINLMNQKLAGGLGAQQSEPLWLHYRHIAMIRNRGKLQNWSV